MVIEKGCYEREDTTNATAVKGCLACVVATPYCVLIPSRVLIGEEGGKVTKQMKRVKQNKIAMTQRDAQNGVYEDGLDKHEF